MEPIFLPRRVTANVLNTELIGEEPTEDRIVAVRQALINREWTVEHIRERLNKVHAADPTVTETLDRLEAEEAEAAKEA